MAHVAGLHIVQTNVINEKRNDEIINKYVKMFVRL